VSAERVDVPLGDVEVDITDPDAYLDGFPHATFERLRRDEPVSWWPEHDGGSGFWAITRYDDLIVVSRDVDTFSNAQGITWEEMAPEDFQGRRNMLEYDPPQHTRFRRLVSKPFSRREVYAYEQAIRTLATAVIDEAFTRSPSGQLDFVEDIAKQLPMRMLGRLLGVPDEDGPWLVERGDKLLGNLDPEVTEFPVGLVDTDEFKSMPFRSPAGLDLYRYADQQAALRRTHPTDDVITALLAPTIDGEVLTQREFQNFFTLLVDSAVEEMLRWGSVTMNFRRTATRDVEMHGRQIRAGQKVVIWFASANFDHDQFPEPYHFDIHRTPNDHVAFGRMSPHLCLGAQLARMELKLLFEELLPRLSDAQQSAPERRLRSNFMAGMKELPVALTYA
jgi:cytochrome P450